MKEMNERATNTLLALLVLFASIDFLSKAQTVIVPLLVALLLSYLAYPLVEWMTKFKVPTAVAIGVVVLLAIGILGGFALLIRETVANFQGEYPRYEAQLETFWQSTLARLHIRAHDLQQLNLGEEVRGWVKSLAASTLGSVVNFITQFLLVLFYLVFLLLGHHLVPQKLNQAFTPERGGEIAQILDEMHEQVLRYIGLKTALSVAIGAITWATLVFFRVDFALLWGITAFVLYYIPTVGSIVASIPPILLALLQYDAWTALWVTTCLTGVQAVIGNVVEPRVMGKGLDLDPLIILVGLVFFGWMWGIIGAVLSVPLMVVVKIACAHVESLRPMAVLMGMGTLPTRHGSKPP